MEYEVRFEVFDKKLKVKVNAVTEIDALEYVKEAIKIHSIVPAQAQENTSKTRPKPPKNGTVEDWQKYLNDLLAGLDKKK